MQNSTSYVSGRTRLLFPFWSTAGNHHSLGGIVIRLREVHQRKRDSNSGMGKVLLLLEIVQVGSGGKAEEV